MVPVGVVVVETKVIEGIAKVDRSITIDLDVEHV